MAAAYRLNCPATSALPSPVAIDVQLEIRSGIGMLTEPQREHVRLATRTAQVISISLAAGVIFFAAVVLSLTGQKPPAGAPQVPILSYAAVAIALVAMVMRLIVPGMLAARTRSAVVQRDTARVPQPTLANTAELGDIAPLMGVFQTKVIVGTALLEGAAFFCLVAYLIERQPSSLVVAGVLFCLLIGQIPTVGRTMTWIESELVSIGQMRALERS